MIRLRIKVVHWPRRTLVLTDTPRPDCPVCEGLGGIEHHYLDHAGEYGGSDWEPCGCWNEHRRYRLIPLPDQPRRWRRLTVDRDPWGPAGYSDEPPF
ncbi:hypothetical protein ABZX85_32950 [Streptomyces sp. NPDC004539]|uniref:hypothetical protein n=1 Tax=Streptomyces sp. NPDC004539 TaxID=3154280 RepID=UPI0033B54EB0